MKVYGAVAVHGIEYEDNEILDIIKDHPFTRLVYGHNWDYLGDQGIEESNICITDDDNNELACFGGIVGLNDLIEWQKRGCVPYVAPTAKELATTALARYVAESMVSNAKDNGDDPLTYLTDVEVVELYAKDLLKEASEQLPNIVKQLIGK